MSRRDLLRSPGNTVFLVDVAVGERKVEAGIAYFDPGLPAVVEVADDETGESFALRIPPDLVGSQGAAWSQNFQIERAK